MNNCHICNEIINLNTDSFFSRIQYNYDQFKSQAIKIHGINPISEQRLYFCVGCIVHRGFVTMKNEYKLPSGFKKLANETEEQLVKYCTHLKTNKINNAYWELDNGFNVSIINMQGNNING